MGNFSGKAFSVAEPQPIVATPEVQAAQCEVKPCPSPAALPSDEACLRNENHGSRPRACDRLLGLQSAFPICHVPRDGVDCSSSGASSASSSSSCEETPESLSCGSSEAGSDGAYTLSCPWNALSELSDDDAAAAEGSSRLPAGTSAGTSSEAAGVRSPAALPACSEPLSEEDRIPSSPARCSPSDSILHDDAKTPVGKLLEGLAPLALPRRPSSLCVEVSSPKVKYGLLGVQDRVGTPFLSADVDRLVGLVVSSALWEDDE